MPMGVTNGPYYFNLYIGQIIRELPTDQYQRVQFYVDDIIIVGSTQEECDTTVQQVIQILEGHNIMINPAKSILAAQRSGITGVLYRSSDPGTRHASPRSPTTSGYFKCGH